MLRRRFHALEVRERGYPRLTVLAKVAPSEDARRTLNEIFSTPNDLFAWFASLYLQGVRAHEFSDDEIALARKCMLQLYEYAGRDVPCYFPREPLEKLFDPGQRRWRDLLYRMQMARVRRD